MGMSHESTSDPVVLAPESQVEVAAALRRAADARQSLLIRGAGTKLDWGRPAGRVDVVLDMRRLNRVLAHEHGDMTATIEAGATLADTNRALARHGQWLPLDPPHAETATIGGILATNDSGPLRHRYGTPRDLLIGIELATTDGVLAKAGGRVVKNVAGYDLGKLVTGSFGSLAAIVSATFKLSPIPAASKTLRLDVADRRSLAAMVRAVMASQLEPMAFEISAPSAGGALSALLRFASLPAVVDAQIERASALVSACATGVAVVDGDAQQALWRDHATRIWRDGDAALVRASWLPASIDAVAGAVDGELIGRAAIGAGVIRIGGDDDAQVRAIDELRRSRDVGNVVVVRGSAALKRRIDVWPPHGDRQPVFDALKRALDPHHVLNAGRGPL
jgi:glycolate dehydrogenase FAD-binding subunit